MGHINCSQFFNFYTQRILQSIRRSYKLSNSYFLILPWTSKLKISSACSVESSETACCADAALSGAAHAETTRILAVRISRVAVGFALKLDERVRSLKKVVMTARALCNFTGKHHTQVEWVHALAIALICSLLRSLLTPFFFFAAAGSGSAEALESLMLDFWSYLLLFGWVEKVGWRNWGKWWSNKNKI